MTTAPFSPTSRYAGIEVANLTLPPSGNPGVAGTGGRGNTTACLVPYVRRRFIPPPERFALLQEHTIVEGDRVDNLTAQYLGDPEQFWRLCDANAVMRPDELTDTVGRLIRITLPEGVAGVSNG